MVPDTVFLQMAVQFANMKPERLRAIQAKQKQLAAQGREFSLLEIAKRTKSITPEQADWFVQYYENQSGDGEVDLVDEPAEDEPVDDEPADDEEAEDSPDPDEADEDEDDGPRVPRRKGRLGGSRSRGKVPGKKGSRVGKGSRAGVGKKGPKRKGRGKAPAKRGANARDRFRAAAAAEREGEEEEGTSVGWMIFLGICILVGVLSAVFDDSDREQPRTEGGYVIVRGKKVFRGK